MMPPVARFSLFLLLVGCNSTPPIGSNTHREDLSSGGHRTEAAEHHEAANTATHASTPTARDETGGHTATEDPHAHRAEAAVHLQHAQQLETTYRNACAAVPQAEHATCSIAGRAVAAITDVPNGVAIRFATGGPAAAPTLARAECTHAYADHAGRTQLATCVLAVRDLTLAARDEAGAVVLTATTAHAASVEDLRNRARGMQQTR